MTCAPSKDSHQHAHSHSLFRILTGCILVSKGAKCLHADIGDSDHIARMRRLILVFFGRMSEGTLSHVATQIDFDDPILKLTRELCS